MCFAEYYKMCFAEYYKMCFAEYYKMCFAEYYKMCYADYNKMCFAEYYKMCYAEYYKMVEKLLEYWSSSSLSSPAGKTFKMFYQFPFLNYRIQSPNPDYLF